MTREASTLLLVHDAQQVCAGVGIQDPFAKPDVTLPARVGRRTDDSGEYLVGEALTRAEAANEALEIVCPLANGDVQDWDALAALWQHILAELQVRPSHNTFFTMVALPMPLSRGAYERTAQIFFEKFNTPALCISEVPLLAAYAAGVLNAMVVDVGAEETSAVAVSDCAIVPTAAVLSKLGTVHCTWWLAYLLVHDAPVREALQPLVTPDLSFEALAYALAQFLVAEGHVRIDVSADVPGLDEPDAEDNSFDVAAALVEGRERDVVKERQKKNEKPLASDVIHVDFRGVSVPVGRVRTRFHEPLLHPQLLERVTLSLPAPPAVRQALHARRIGGEPICVSVPEAVAMAAAHVQPSERRTVLWENLVVTGSATRFKGLVPELLRSFTTYVANEPTEGAQVVGEPNPAQPRAVRAHKVPDYFPEFKEHLELLPYLGATIYAKLVFNDTSGRNYISKMQYNDGGPSVAFAIGSA